MRRPHSSTLVSTFDAPSHARWAPPSCATESSPYSLRTRAYSRSARAVPAVVSGTAPAPVWTSPRNSSRNSRRSDFADREYRANSAPFTVSGRLISANTGRSVLLKYGASARTSSAVNVSGIFVGGSTVAVFYLSGHARLALDTQNQHECRKV